MACQSSTRLEQGVNVRGNRLGCSTDGLYKQDLERIISKPTEFDVSVCMGNVNFRTNPRLL